MRRIHRPVGHQAVAELFPRKSRNGQQLRRSRQLRVPLLVIAVIGAMWLNWGTHSASLPTEQKPLQIYATQCRHDFRQLLSQAIEQAKVSIDLSIYSLTDPSLIELIKKKSEESVRVTIICDSTGASTLQKRVGPKIVVQTMQSIKGLMHRKILVIDEQLFLLGSANFTGESLWWNDNLMSAILNPELAKALANAIRTQENPISPIFKEIDSQLVELWLMPSTDSGLKRMRSLIQGAQKTVKVAMYTLTHPALVQDLIHAHQRKVNVQVYIDRKSSFGASQNAALSLQEGGINVRVNQGQQILHHKTCLVDDQTLCMGSINWTKAAFTKNAESFMIITPLKSEQRQLLNRLFRIIELESIPWQLEESEPTLLQALGF